MKQNIYVDMDGVVADFNREEKAVERFAVERGFFRGLRPIHLNVRAVKKLAVKHNVFILTASPNARADRDKRQWLKAYMPFIKRENIIICRNGARKVDNMRTASGILFDDYGKNIREWLENANNRAFKVSPQSNIKYYEKRLTIR